MVVEALMSGEPIVVRTTGTIRRALSKAREGDVRHLPVIEDGRLVGIVSDRDLREACANAFNSVSIDDNFLDEPVSRIMSIDVITVSHESELSEVIDLMIEHKVGALPVLADEGMVLVGIISYIDARRAARAAL
jgi:acetoin utilization protein AcuB